MAEESSFVALAQSVAEHVLPDPLFVMRGAALLYQVTVDNQLSLTVDPKKPVRGSSAFQTDLCVFERISSEVTIPRVVLEFKTSITTHDVLTYSAKATKHKQVYPYLRYGIIASGNSSVPGRLFTHNESLDFCAALQGVEENALKDFFESFLTDEVETSRCLERIAFGSVQPRLFRTEVLIKSF